MVEGKYITSTFITVPIGVYIKISVYTASMVDGITYITGKYRLVSYNTFTTRITITSHILSTHNRNKQTKIQKIQQQNGNIQ